LQAEFEATHAQNPFDRACPQFADQREDIGGDIAYLLILFLHAVQLFGLKGRRLRRPPACDLLGVDVDAATEQRLQHATIGVPIDAAEDLWSGKSFSLGMNLMPSSAQRPKRCSIKPFVSDVCSRMIPLCPRKPVSGQSHLPRRIDFDLRSKTNIQSVEHFHRSFKSHPKILIPLVPRHL
jgi:hypothetical protein